MATDAFDGSGALTSPWVDYIPASASNLTQTGGQLLPGQAAESEGNYYGGAATGNNQYSEIVVAGSLGSAQTYWTASARVSGTGGSRNLYQVTVTSNAYYISKVTAGSGTDLATGSGTFNGSVTPFTLRIETEDSGSDVIIRGYKDGVLIDSATDSSSPHTGGQPGFECYADSASFLTPINSWAGGDLATVELELEETSGVSMAGTMGVSGDISITTGEVFELVVSPALALIGTLGVSGDLEITPAEAFELVITSPVGLQGAVTFGSATFGFGSLGTSISSGKFAPAAMSGDALKIGTAPAVVFTNGLGFDSFDALVMTDTPVGSVGYLNGLPFDSNGSLCVVDKAAAASPFSYSCALKIDANGFVVTVDVGAATAPTTYHGSLAFDATGALITTV